MLCADAGGDALEERPLASGAPCECLCTPVPHGVHPLPEDSLAMALKRPGNQGPCCGLQWTLAKIRKHMP